MRKVMRFSGQVQGVGFRATARSVAEELGLVGWVRNDVDGSVELEVQGDQHLLEAFVTEIHQAMGRKIVSSESRPIDEVSGEIGFSIKR
jgi:acylphosphatase